MCKPIYLTAFASSVNVVAGVGVDSVAMIATHTAIKSELEVPASCFQCNVLVKIKHMYQAK